jgi:hypothetical protein
MWMWITRPTSSVERGPSDYGAETPVLDWRDRLVCSQCGSRKVDMVVSGTVRR